MKNKEMMFGSALAYIEGVKHSNAAPAANELGTHAVKSLGPFQGRLIGGNHPLCLRRLRKMVSSFSLKGKHIRLAMNVKGVTAQSGATPRR
jgi:hypothetical protein